MANQMVIGQVHDRWRHVTLKGQAREPNMFGTHCLETTGDTCTLQTQLQWSTAANGTSGVEWSRAQ